MALSYGICLGPQNTQYSSEQFCHSLQNVTSDGVCAWGSGFAASVEGLTLTVGTGFGLAAGHWLKNDEDFTLPVPHAYDHRDRTDLAALQVDFSARKMDLVLLEDVEPDHSPNELYLVPLYALRVKRGATNLLPGDLSDLRGFVPTLSGLTLDGLRAYDFTSGGIDRQIGHILDLADQLILKADAAIAELDREMVAAGGTPGVGDLNTCRKSPEPLAHWLRCNGGEIPPEYTALRALIGDVLPQIQPQDPRLGTWIFSGPPQTL